MTPKRFKENMLKLYSLKRLHDKLEKTALQVEVKAHEVDSKLTSAFSTMKVKDQQAMMDFEEEQEERYMAQLT